MISFSTTKQSYTTTTTTTTTTTRPLVYMYTICMLVYNLTGVLSYE